MSVEIKCKGETAQDCWQCGRMFSSHSEHYCRTYKRKVSNVSCSIGGNRTFNEDGERIN